MSAFFNDFKGLCKWSFITATVFMIIGFAILYFNDSYNAYECSAIDSYFNQVAMFAIGIALVPPIAVLVCIPAFMLLGAPIMGLIWIFEKVGETNAYNSIASKLPAVSTPAIFKTSGAKSILNIIGESIVLLFFLVVVGVILSLGYVAIQTLLHLLFENLC